MKKALLALLLLPTFSQASILNMEFAGAVNGINYATCTIFAAGNCSAWNHANQNTSSAYVGIPLSVGNQLTGSFSYNTDALYTMSSDRYQAVYLDGVLGSSLTIGGMNLPSSSLPAAGFGSFSIVDGRSGADIFMLQQVFQNNDWFGIMSVFLQDRNGMVFNSFDVPTSVNEGDFTYAQMRLTFLQRSTGDQLQLYSNLTDYGITATQVPEPSSAALAMIGVAGLLMTRRRKKAT